jgi:hypothetical protein
MCGMAILAMLRFTGKMPVARFGLESPLLAFRAQDVDNDLSHAYVT